MRIATDAPGVERAVTVRVREATLRDLDAVVALRVALLEEYPDHPVYGRIRPDLGARARELFGSQLRSPLERIFLACGYQRRDAFRFAEKKLDAFWYHPPAPGFPRRMAPSKFSSLTSLNNVFNNDKIDGSFGITSPIFLDQVT